jgi:hypothetical protein
MSITWVTQACNLSYLRGRNQEDMGKVSLGKKLVRPHLSQWLGAVACACRSSYSRKHE